MPARTGVVRSLPEPPPYRRRRPCRSSTAARPPDRRCRSTPPPACAGTGPPAPRAPGAGLGSPRSRPPAVPLGAVGPPLAAALPLTPVAPGVPLDGAPHGQRFGLLVEVGPLQAERFPLAQTERQGQREPH